MESSQKVKMALSDMEGGRNSAHLSLSIQNKRVRLSSRYSRPTEYFQCEPMPPFSAIPKIFGSAVELVNGKREKMNSREHPKTQ